MSIRRWLTPARSSSLSFLPDPSGDGGVAAANEEVLAATKGKKREVNIIIMMLHFDLKLQSTPVKMETNPQLRSSLRSYVMSSLKEL